MSGTTSTAEKNNLNAADVCSIIRACGESRVVELKLGDLHVRFAGDPETVTGTPAVDIGAVRFPPLPAAMVEPDHEQINQETLLAEELRLREEEIREMLIRDPLLAEKLIMQGELKESDADGADEA